MKKFVVIYHTPAAMQEKMKHANHEKRQKEMESWNVWAKKCGEHLVDMGTPLMGGEKLHTGGKSEAGNRSVAGYSLIQAKDMKHAKDLLKDHPHLAWDASCNIEVHEAMPTPGM